MPSSVVLITSLLDCPADRSVFDRKTRFEQTKRTIQSIKEKFSPQDTCIILIDCTKLTEEEKKYFVSEINILIDCSENEAVRKAVYSQYKSDGERSYLLATIDFMETHPEIFGPDVRHFFKLSGRYWLDENFSYEKYDKNSDVITTVDPKIWECACVSCLFKLSWTSLPKFKTELLRLEPLFRDEGLGMEQFMHYYVHCLGNEAIHLPILGCGGEIAINGIEQHS